MLAQEVLGANQPVETAAKAWLNKGLHAAIRGRVTFGLSYDTEPREHPHAVRVQAKRGVAARQEQDLFGAWLADPWKAHECFFGLRQWQAANPLEAAAKLV